MSPAIVEAARQILAARQRLSATGADLERAMDAFMDALRVEADPGQPRMALDHDRDALLPPDLKSAAYERLLELNGRHPAALREYAWHLPVYGPDRGDEAETLIAEVERSDSHG